ncbi:helicase associated domain-containing protein [Arthrobacter sp. BE255]|uniref:helicase associated domain-containing protein n=1 Tax=Arthrobacter sp. BE255 TaxID=2817721 RepID=UPI0028627467|nr:helicase associated domain-containing protein [Arthrobacter sp. BE255]MDR7161388.1 hypothetical protein [Arthrobacter sp. BE255]
MAPTSRRAAPYQEWVLMYRKGLTRGKIASLTGAPPATVGYHLEIARTLDRELLTEHVTANPRAAKVTPQGMTRMRQLITFVQQTGKYPSSSSDLLLERTLAVWLNRRHREAAEGRLASVIHDGLKVLPDWEGKTRKATDERRWQDRLRALAESRAMGQDWPRHRGLITDEEHDLGVWLHTQRFKSRRGELDPAKIKALDSAVPGWRTGRTRGRKPAAKD